MTTVKLHKFLTPIALILLSSFSGLASVASAMTLEVKDNLVFATGPVDDDLKKFEEAFAKPGVDTVVFVNSPGGDLWTGLRVGRLISSSGFKTVTAGSCVSACSIMFMGGKERRFSDAFRPNQTYVGIHGAHNKDTKRIDPQMQPQIFAFYKSNMGENFNASVMNQALYEMDDSGALLKVYDTVRSAKTAPVHCRSFQSVRDQCTKFPEANALNLGVVTHADLVKLSLPTAMQAKSLVMGQALTKEVPDMASYLADVATRQCVSDACKNRVREFAGKSENRALALPLQGPGLGSSWNTDSTVMAANRAVFSCNHTTGMPTRLCEADTVNGFEVRHFYAIADEAHQLALAKLTLPAEKYYANEEFGGNFTSANAVRTQQWYDITPSRIEGIKTVGTQDLVRALLADKDLRVLEVTGVYKEILPGSQVMMNAGLATENPAVEALMEKRFANLLSVIAPDTAKPVVFYCSGRNCWLSVNAALRAKKLGYSDVHWYRGGMESWVAAGLPVAPAVVRAVAN